MTKFISLICICLLPLLAGCTGCSKSAQKERLLSRNENSSSERRSDRSSSNRGNNIVKMKKYGGVYEIPVEINGSKMDFIFDTGASDITISATEAMFLYKQGTLTEDDIKGTQQYRIADGSLSEGTVINLRTVKLGNKLLHNVQASVMHNNDAPILFGQSALSQFGRVTIDYKKDEISFD